MRLVDPDMRDYYDVAQQDDPSGKPVYVRRQRPVDSNSDPWWPLLSAWARLPRPEGGIDLLDPTLVLFCGKLYYGYAWAVAGPRLLDFEGVQKAARSWRRAPEHLRRRLLDVDGQDLCADTRAALPWNWRGWNYWMQHCLPPGPFDQLHRLAGSPVIAVTGTRRDAPGVTADPSLKELGFSHLMDAGTCWRSIDQYLGSTAFAQARRRLRRVEA